MLTSVIRGDIMNSRMAENPDIWLKTLKEELQGIGEMPKTWEIFMGDYFQAELKEVGTVLLKAITLKASIKCIKSLDVKMAIGIGSKTYDAPRISESNGEAFIFSGELFDSLKKTTLAVKTPWKEIDNNVNFALDLILPTMNSWKPGTARVVRQALKMPDATQAEIGKSLKISQGNVSEALSRAGYSEILAIQAQFRELIKNKI